MRRLVQRAPAVAALALLALAAPEGRAAPGAPGAPPVGVRFDPAAPRLGDPVVVYVEVPAEHVDRDDHVDLFGFRVPLQRVGPSLLRAVAAVPVDVPPRSYLAEVQRGGEVVRVWLNVEDRAFAKDQLSVAKRFTSKVDKTLKARLERETRAWEALFEPPPTPSRLKGGAQRPDGNVTATFGDQRMFNGKVSSVHYGLDLNGRVGDPVTAVQEGRVVMSALRWMSGGTIVLDHGGGVFSAYFHLSARERGLGRQVHLGERIGRVGKTGRVTGPHLHLAVLVRMVELKDGQPGKPRGLFVDPETFLALELEP